MWIRDLGMQELGCEVCGVKGEGCGVQDAGCRVQDMGCRMHR